MLIPTHGQTLTGAATDYRDINGLTPLYYSILNKAALKVTQLLLIHSKNSVSSNELTTNTESNSNDSRLPAYGITDSQGWQEVHQACKLGLDAHLEKLLYYGCDINAKISGSGNTPLHVAAINDQLNCAKVLLLRGADKTITNSSHQTAHQVAVIANNMEMAEFIAEHNDSKVVPFRNQSANPTDHHHYHHQSNHRSSVRSSSLANSHSLASIANGQQHRAIVQPLLQIEPQLQQTQQQQVVLMKPLRLDVAQAGQQQHSSNMTPSASNATTTSSSGAGGSQPHSLLSIGALQNTNCQQLNVQVNNISPCLSQRSCATSNTTSSSGVCCDGEGSNPAEELNHQQLMLQYQQQLQPQTQFANSLSQHSSLTIDNNNNNDSNAGIYSGQTNNTNNSTFIPSTGAFSSLFNRADDKMHDANANGVADNDDEIGQNDDDEDLKSSGSSSNGLYSLMSEERPLFVGSIVEAASDYQSGDPNHLQLRRGDLIEVLDYTADQLQFGQLPRLANKPMLFGKRQSDGMTGLFPSFCVNRAKQKQSKMRQKLPTTGSTLVSTISTEVTSAQQVNSQAVPQRDTCRVALSELNHNNIIDHKGLHESQSLGLLPNQLDRQMNSYQQVSSQNILGGTANQPKVVFREIQVTLTKSRGGFGFALRGAKVDPGTLASNKGQANKIAIDERLMAANNLVSLQYLDEIETGGAAHQANLKRGDFIVAVNGQDVRLQSHEQVVSLIRQSGDRVHLTLATPISREPMAPSYMSKTLPKVKPEPPKRDPNTTLTRNKAQRVKSMFIQMQHQEDQQQRINQNDPFDSNRPLPQTPSAESLMSPTGSLNLMSRHSLSHNFYSAQSLSSSATDSQSISSASTLSADQQSLDRQQQMQQCQSLGEQATPTHSSSSTATLTTVAAMKPTNGSQFCNNAANSNISAPNSAVQPMASSQTTYQPAVIMTTKRSFQSHKSSPSTPPKSVVHSNTIPILEAPISTPSPPPPPPPLPDFSISPPAVNRLSQRRISAPIDQSKPDSLRDGRNLLKKRESLVVVGQSSSQNSQEAPVPAQFGAVAAACAAAANNRLLRQQQQQQHQDLQQQQQEEQMLPDLVQKTIQLQLDQSVQKVPLPPKPLPLPPPLPPQHLQHPQTQQQHQPDQPRPPQQQLQQKQPHYHPHHHHHHHHYHQEHQKQVFEQQHFHTKQNNNHNHSIDYQQHYQPEAASVTKGPTPEYIQQQQQQQQQLFLLHQQHLLQQQLRQQQLLQQQQQQFKLQQQVQLQQRLCLYGKHGLTLDRSGTQDDQQVHVHNHANLDHHHRAYDTYDNHHHQHHQDHAGRYYDTSTARSRHQCRRSNK